MATSAGLLVYRLRPSGPQFLLGHPGGPLWRKRELGAWTIPKGLVEPGEDPFAAARREFREETGLAPPDRDAALLTPIRQRGGKRVLCWAVEAELELDGFHPGDFEMIWPPRSGRTARFPEIDQLRYFPADEALERILPAQAALLREMLGRLEAGE